MGGPNKTPVGQDYQSTRPFPQTMLQTTFYVPSCHHRPFNAIIRVLRFKDRAGGKKMAKDVDAKTK